MKNSESHFASLSMSCEGMSPEKSYLRLILAALQCKISKELKLSLQLKPPHTGNAYITEGKITLRYKSKRIFPGKNWLLFNMFSLPQIPSWLQGFVESSLACCRLWHLITWSMNKGPMNEPLCKYHGFALCWMWS